MRFVAASLWCSFCPVGLQQPIWTYWKRYSAISQFCGDFYFRVKSSFPVLFTQIIALLCWFHWKQLPEWSTTCCQKMGEGEYKLASLIWASNYLLFFFSLSVILLVWLGNLMHLFWFRLVNVFPRIQFWRSLLHLCFWFFFSVFFLAFFFFHCLAPFNTWFSACKFSELLQVTEFLRGWRRSSKQENTPENIL